MVAVTRVTGGAVSSDELSEGDYRDIFDELRRKTTLRGFSEFIGSAVSFAWWGQFEKGEKGLSQDRKSELRRAVGLPALPLTVEQATAHVDPDGVVWAVGEGVPDRVVLVGRETHEPLLLRLNGDLHIVEELRTGAGTGADTGADTQVRPYGMGECTGASAPGGERRQARSSIVIGREAWERLNAVRLEEGMEWGRFLGELLNAWVVASAE